MRPWRAGVEGVFDPARDRVDRRGVFADRVQRPVFTAAWIGFGFGFGEAILCLVGAGVFAALLYAGEGFLRGDIDLGELQARRGRHHAHDRTQTWPKARHRQPTRAPRAPR